MGNPSELKAEAFQGTICIVGGAIGLALLSMMVPAFDKSFPKETASNMAKTILIGAVCFWLYAYYSSMMLLRKWQKWAVERGWKEPPPEKRA
jgi:hypothetical protein